MKLQANNDGWCVALQDGLLQLVQIDFRLGLFFADASGKAQLFLETACRLKGPNIDAVLNPANAQSLAPILSLFNAKVNAISAKKTGELEVHFDHNYILEVGPNESHEAWQFGCSGSMLVCSPGGKVSHFQQTYLSKSP